MTKLQITFAIFMITQFFRIFYDRGINDYYITHDEVFVFFLIFSVIPFFVFSNYRFDENAVILLRNALFTGGAVFTILSLVLYGSLLGQVGRLSVLATEEGTLNPLILSYNSAMTIGVIIFYMAFNKVRFWLKILLISLVIMALIPFLLGASRGGLIALLVPVVLMVFASGKIKNIISFVMLGLFSFYVIYFLDNIFGSAFFDRFNSLGQDIERGSDSAIRISIWNNSIAQFWENPLLGDKLAVDGWENYPHNIILESLQTVGLIGTAPFLYLIVTAFRSTFQILRYYKRHAWIGVVYLQAFIQNMFSGSLFTANWFWVSLVVVICFGRYLASGNSYQLLKSK
jgi:O-antigen ligase